MLNEHETEYATSIVFIITGFTFILHPEIPPYIKWVFGSFMMVGGILFFTKIKLEQIREQERFEKYVNSLSKAKGRHE